MPWLQSYLFEVRGGDLHLMRDLGSAARPGRKGPLAMFAFHRFVAVLMKEFVQMRRDRLTFAMMIGVPIMQLVLFGYAINMDPKALPAAVVSADSSPFSRSLVRALENTGYFKIVAQPATRGRGRRAARAAARCSSCCRSPRTSRASCSAASAPSVLVEADATDPAATSNAIAALQQVEHHRPRPRPHRPARARCKAGAAALRDPRAPALQPRGHHAVQHRARASWAWCSR